MPQPTLTATHRRRLREVWRSAGWPCQDMVEVDLLAAGLMQRLRDAQGRETLRVTDAGLQAMVVGRDRHRQALSEHEALAQRVALEMQRAGRLAWRGLALRAPLDPAEEGGSVRWVMAVPDVFSIRHTTREDAVEAVAHEVKVRRADLLSDLRRPDKHAAYRALASQCWYVIKAGIGQADEIPDSCGVMVAHPAAGGCAPFGELQVLRDAPKRAHRLPLATWMALARANAEPPVADDAQALL